MRDNLPPMHHLAPYSKPPSSKPRGRSKDIREPSSSFNIPRPERTGMPSTELSIGTSSKTSGYLDLKRNFTSSEQQISQDVIQVLREENDNLKEQNAFLLNKLRIISTREQETKQAVKNNEILADKLRKHNADLKKEIQYVHELTNSKVEEFGRKLNELSGIEAQPTRISGYLPQETPSGNTSVDNRQITREMFRSPNLESLDELNNQFEGLMYSCKIEQDPNKKKEYRKRLVELANTIRECQK